MIGVRVCWLGNRLLFDRSKWPLVLDDHFEREFCRWSCSAVLSSCQVDVWWNRMGTTSLCSNEIQAWPAKPSHFVCKCPSEAVWKFSVFLQSCFLLKGRCVNAVMRQLLQRWVNNPLAWWASSWSSFSRYGAVSSYFRAVTVCCFLWRLRTCG